MFHKVRTPTRWLRAALLAVLIGFGLNTIAHVAHSHEGATQSSHHLSCGYCVHLGNLADAPNHQHTLLPATLHVYVVGDSHDRAHVRAPSLAAQPRAPPFS
jgi:hypothetical protein